MKISNLAIQVENLVTKFGNNVIHDDISFSIAKNSICSIVGGSGSGKTTLLNILLALLKPFQGTIKVLDIDILKLNDNSEKDLRRNTSVLFQDGALFSGLNVFENIIFPVNEAVSLSERHKKILVERSLEEVDLDFETSSKMPSELSGGMKKRVGLARALVLEPTLLFLDEPTSGLDPITARNFNKLITTLQKKFGMTIFMISHDIESVLSLSDQIIGIGDKKIIYNGSVSGLPKSENKWIKEYFNC
jgi:phospholipid/cholesterol/gamma-HCH transport system ATP-binding protein